jgi:hypothetical protein
MNGQEIAEKLIALVTGNQCGVATMRSLLSWLDDDNVIEFYETLGASEFAEQVQLACYRNGLIPKLAPGMRSPLELTEDQQNYANPEAATQFLEMQFGSMSSAPNAEQIALEVAKGSVQVLGQDAGLESFQGNRK